MLQIALWFNEYTYILPRQRWMSETRGDSVGRQMPHKMLCMWAKMIWQIFTRPTEIIYEMNSDSICNSTITLTIYKKKHCEHACAVPYCYEIKSTFTLVYNMNKYRSLTYPTITRGTSEDSQTTQIEAQPETHCNFNKEFLSNSPLWLFHWLNMTFIIVKRKPRSTKNP
jgi:hypothetical protein